MSTKHSGSAIDSSFPFSLVPCPLSLFPCPFSLFCPYCGVFPSASRFAVIRNAPGTPYGSWRCNAYAKYVQWPFPYLAVSQPPDCGGCPLSKVEIIGVYALSHVVQNFDPRCSTQSLKSAGVILLGQLNDCSLGARMVTGESSSDTSSALGVSSPGNGANSFGTI